LLKQLAIKIKPDGSDVAALLRAEDVPGTADFEVAHGDFESAAEAGILFNGADSLAGVHKETGVARQQEVGIRLVLVTAHAAAKLVKLTESKAVGAINDDGVGVRDIEPAFDDGGGEKNIGLTIHKLR